MDKYQIMEQQGRDKFKRLCDKLGREWHPNPNEMDYYDGTVYHNGKTYLIEIKNRDAECDKYPTIIYEVEKHNNLIQTITDTGADGGYYVTFIGDTAWTYDITLPYIDELPIYTMKCNRHTAEDDIKVNKSVRFLPKEGNNVHIYTIND